MRLTFRIDDEAEGVIFRRLVIQLTGRTADIFLLDELNRIHRRVARTGARQDCTKRINHHRDRQKSRVRRCLIGPGSTFRSTRCLLSPRSTPQKPLILAPKALRSKLTKSIRQQRTLKEHLQQDLIRHGNPEEHKRIGDLLLANIATAVRDGNKVRIT